MLTFSSAITLAQIELNKIQFYGSSYVLLPEFATETPYGWLIPWAQADYRSTKEVSAGGNGPLFVDAFTGEVTQLGISESGRLLEWVAEYAIKRGYEKKP